MSEKSDLSHRNNKGTLPHHKVALLGILVILCDLYRHYFLYYPMISSILHYIEIFYEGGTQLGTVSWEHFFASLNQYYASLRQEVPQVGYSSYMRGTPYRTHGTPMAVVRSITPQEVDGLRAVLSLIGTVVKQVNVAHSLIAVFIALLFNLKQLNVIWFNFEKVKFWM